jgi:hypothetical protein
MKIVVTGFDARSARITPGAAKFSMGFLIGETFFQTGHDADHSTTWTTEWDDADRIYVGLASPLGLSSTYAYTALAVLDRYWDDPRLRLFIDDPDTRKIVHGAASAIRRKTARDPLFDSKAFRNRPGMEAARSQADVLYDVCARLTDPSGWPRTLVPVQCHWFDPRVTEIAGTGCRASGIDFTRVVEETLPFPGEDTVDQSTHGGGWVIEPYRAARWAEHIRVSRHRMEIPSRSSAQSRLSLYRGAFGVLESPPVLSDSSGWWTPYATLAAHAGTFYATKLSPAHVPGIQHSAYYVLPDVFETLPTWERHLVVQRQREELQSTSPSLGQVQQDLLV